MNKGCKYTANLLLLFSPKNIPFSFLAGKSKKRDQCKNHQLYPLSETQYCPCNKYNAQPVGNWSDCVLPEGGRVEGQLGMKVQGDIKECGQGYRYQSMACYDQDNRIVETSRCNSHGGFVTLSLSTLCGSNFQVQNLVFQLYRVHVFSAGNV